VDLPVRSFDLARRGVAPPLARLCSLLNSVSSHVRPKYLLPLPCRRPIILLQFYIHLYFTEEAAIHNKKKITDEV